MRALKILTIVMGVMIVAGTVTLAVLITTRVSAGPPPAVEATLDEPPGTAIAGIAPLGDRLAIQLHGGGPDRVLLLDARSGRVVGPVALAH